VALLVFISGCAALVFQIAWMRELRLVFGATTAATAAVLAIFMAGLGIGSAFLGKLADRVINPLRMYGLLELGIALSTAVTPWLVTLASAIYYQLGGQESLGIAAATAVRLALAAAIMAVPTVLMGGTLPAAVRAVTSTTDAHRRALAVLYGANTLGAVCGAAAATFFALESLGTRATLLAGCALGALAGAIAVVISRSVSPIPSPQSSQQRLETRDNVARPRDATSSYPTLVYVTAALLGFTFFALELVWYRMLGPILGGTAFTFGLILCVALFGIGAGGFAYHAVSRRLRPSWSALAVTCGLEALLTIVPFALGDRLALLAAWRTQAAASFGQLIAGWALVTGIVVLPVALVAGFQFPLLIALLGQGRDAVSRHLGLAYAWNTFGAIAGSLIAGFGGMPLLTAPGMWQAIAVVLAVLSLAILALAPSPVHDARMPRPAPMRDRERGSEMPSRITRRTALGVAALALASIGLSFAQGPTAVWRHSGIGARRVAMPSDPNELRNWLNKRRHVLVWEAEGVESSVGILGENGFAFVVNGKSDGNALDDAATQIGAAILGAALHDDPKTGLVIGLGTGESAGWLADMRNVEHVDVVELEPAIDEMATRCRDVNRDVLNHPEVRRIYNDGREFVFTTDNKYDIIISEPSNPYRAGVAALYTSEFYQRARGRLNPNGMFIQWLQAYEVDATTIEIVIATARSVFKHVEVWQSLAADLQLVCSDAPIENSTGELRERIASGALHDALAIAWNVHDVEGFLGHFMANSQWADAISRQANLPLNTDDRTILEYRFAKSVGRFQGFAVEPLRFELQTSGYHLPTLAGDPVDHNALELRRQQFNFLFSGQLSTALLPQPQDQALVVALRKFQLSDFAGALAQWPTEHRQPNDPVLQLVLARTYAELAQRECLALLAAAEEAYPIDAAAVRAIYHWRGASAAESVDALEQFYMLLRERPWIIPLVSETAVLQTADIAKAHPEFAPRLVQLLSHPFASNRFNYIRQMTRVKVAHEISPETVVEALTELEPHITWSADILEIRAKAYAAVNHRLATCAERDWQQFQNPSPGPGEGI
jgi:MFS family permease